MISAEVIALVLASFLAGGLVKGALGLGLPVVVLAVLAPTIGLKAALGVIVLPALVSNVWQALSGPSLGALLRRLWAFLLAAAIGIWAGTAVLAGADTPLLEGLLGTILVVYASISLITPPMPTPGRHEGWLSPVAGGLGGVLTGLTGIFIVPGILYLEALRMPREVFVQALGITFITLSLALGTGLTGNGLMTGGLALLSAVAVLPALGGMALGRRLRAKVSEAGYRRAFFAGLIVAGGYMIARAAGIA